ncbi:hypothetical protein [Nocardia vulneris]|uniref:Uncharacterized protein n=1 Tax=Nocardia vulneris TaxID=1141657 RepID=A0ABR4Z3Z1_9NOCA|nr:hypothetical protein [Nocardia vulneris]KIA60022.1 hypothetical protein FG87_39590 [Nocardia vulneris]
MQQPREIASRRVRTVDGRPMPPLVTRDDVGAGAERLRLGVRSGRGAFILVVLSRLRVSAELLRRRRRTVHMHNGRAGPSALCR